MRHLSLGLSPCPNDTSIFFGLLSGRVPLPGIAWQARIADVATLNRLAAARSLEISKMSLYAFGHVRDDYVLLRSGAALGQGCGPLIVAREPLPPERLAALRIGIPGQLTTASLLLQLYGVAASQMVVKPFHAIEAAVAEGQVDAGVLIHEARFTCEARGLHKILDLGCWWEAQTGLPLPLGAIAAQRKLGRVLIGQVEQALRDSIDALRAAPEAARDFIRYYAREDDDAALDGHIDLYVNRFTRCLGNRGEAAIRELLGRAEAAGCLPPCSAGLFA